MYVSNLEVSMRYFNFEFTACEVNVKTFLEDSGYRHRGENFIEAINYDLTHSLDNGLFFCCYNKDKERYFCNFCYENRDYSYSEAEQAIKQSLRSLVSTVTFENFSEITLIDASKHYNECRRRGISCSFMYNRVSVFFDVDDCVRTDKRFKLKENVISKPAVDFCKDAMFDETFSAEIENIEAGNEITQKIKFPVHYTISSKNPRVADFMCEHLSHSLLQAGRIKARRIEEFYDLDPEIYKSGLFVQLVENNYEGIIVLNLNEIYDASKHNFTTACNFLNDFIKEYKKSNLFILVYDQDCPGIAFRLLNLLNKHMFFVNLKEGRGNRDTALKFLQALILNSECAEYVDQVDEFMEKNRLEEFSQSDIFELFEQFESWSNAKNLLGSYSYALADSIMLDRDPDNNDSISSLNDLIGLETVKRQINEIIALHSVEKERNERLGRVCDMPTMHMVFKGNPGTSKTTVAMLFAKIAKDKGILKSGAFVERCGSDLGPLGLTIAFDEAKGGVLFIDEAYGLGGSDTITKLTQLLENKRNETIVILAGYSAYMDNLLDRNEGLKSRVPYMVHFDDYNAEELFEIFKFMMTEKGFSATNDAMDEVVHTLNRAIYVEDFGNGRFVRNLLEQSIQRQSIRLMDKVENSSDIDDSEIYVLEKEDIAIDILNEPAPFFNLPAEQELEQMIGLASAKKAIRRALTGLKFNQICEARGLKRGNPSLHMVFTGNPGTAKTTVARIVAQLLADENILPTGKFIETGRADLVGPMAGISPHMVRNAFRRARGGVLFIDEAYSLDDGTSGGPGQEAINTIVQEMENHREDTIVIMAGYPEEMRTFLDRNPGMRSRIAFHINFEDYSTDELVEITKLMVSKKQMHITPAALKKLESEYNVARSSESFGNGRFVRRQLEQAEMNLGLRIQQISPEKITKGIISIIKKCDIPDLEDNYRSTKIGFSA